MNYYLSFVLLVSAVSQISAVRPPPLNVTVFYESYDAPSTEFIRKQLHYTSILVAAKFNVEFVPFGFSSVKQNPWSYTCKKGPRQCNANIEQACGLKKIKPEKHLDFIDCMVSAYQPDEAGKTCANFVGEEYNEIEKCSYGDEGKQLILKHAKRTKSFTPTITHLPFVVFNNEYNSKDEKLALQDFKKFFCARFPKDDVPRGCEEYNLNEGEEESVRPCGVETVETLEEKLHNSALW